MRKLFCNRTILFFLYTLIFVSTSAQSAPDKKIKDKEQELAVLKTRIESIRDSLQQEIAERWRARQRSVEQRETDKEEFGRLVEAQERSYAALASSNEEGYSRERRLEEIRKQLDDKIETWGQIRSSFGEILEKQADEIAASFPLDIETYRAGLEQIRRDFGKRGDIAASISDLFKFTAGRLETGAAIRLDKRTLLPDGADEAAVLTIARFGNVFGYGMADDGTAYGIQQTGRIGLDRYRIEKIDNPELVGFLRDAFPRWISAGTPHGPVLFDIMQNEQSRSLTTGKRDTFMARSYRFLSAGGPVMIPLLLLPLWALLLVIIKLLQFAGVRSAHRRFMNSFYVSLDAGDEAQIAALLSKKRNFAARVANACFGMRTATRGGAQEAMKEVLLEVFSGLGNHLNTLAVIAGVAPLLGLLGTVTGMISLFEVITRFGTGDPRLLAGGISEALITTEVGLTVAIPILLLHNYIRNKKNQIQSELQVYAMRLLNRFFPEA